MAADKTRNDSGESQTQKKPAQKPFVPHPELGESGDVNAMPQEKGTSQKNSKQPSQSNRDEREKASG